MIYVICLSKIEYIVSSVRLLYLEKDYKIDYIIVIEGMGMPSGHRQTYYCGPWHAL